MPAGRAAIDVGANRGYYSYALSRIATRVEAFEPYPVTARFARRKLGANVRLHEIALSNSSGPSLLRIPQCKGDVDIHYSATLKEVRARKYVGIAVPVLTIDQFKFDDIGFIKVDAEGSGMEVVEDARETIGRCRPNLLLEFLPLYDNPLSCIEHIETTMGYAGRIMVGDRLLDARRALAEFSSSIRTFNVVFTPSTDGASR